VHNWPHLPRTLACSEQVILDLISNDGERISVDETEVGEEDAHEDGTPEELIDGNLREDGDGISSWDLLVEPVVEVVTRGAVVDESEKGEGGKALVIDGASSDEDLMWYLLGENDALREIRSTSNISHVKLQQPKKEMSR
jgi:hypothetical protein